MLRRHGLFHRQVPQPRGRISGCTATATCSSGPGGRRTDRRRARRMALQGCVMSAWRRRSTSATGLFGGIELHHEPLHRPRPARHPVDVQAHADGGVPRTDMSEPRLFATPAALRGVDTNHRTAEGMLGRPLHEGERSRACTWSESVDRRCASAGLTAPQGHRRLLVQIRFTPRRRGSVWSKTDIDKVAALTREKRGAADLKAFDARLPDKSGIYSYEQRPVEIVEPIGRWWPSTAAAFLPPSAATGSS